MARRYKSALKYSLTFGAHADGSNFHCNQKLPRKLKKMYKKILEQL